MKHNGYKPKRGRSMKKKRGHRGKTRKLSKRYATSSSRGGRKL